jgi:peptidyl-prolyl cis-trans isomerase B (cyclophilin B)
MFYLLLLLARTSEPIISEDTTNMTKTNPIVIMKTSKGEIEIELFSDKAPNTVKNFLDYTNSGFYDSTLFHRVIKSFVVQGGGYKSGMFLKETKDPIKIESNNGLSNLRGTIAMARTSDPHSATSQFFFNLVDNTRLDFTAENLKGWGYTVFGKVNKGLEVIDSIAQVPTTQIGMASDVPKQEVLILSVRVLD